MELRSINDQSSVDTQMDDAQSGEIRKNVTKNDRIKPLGARELPPSNSSRSNRKAFEGDRQCEFPGSNTAQSGIQPAL